MLLCPVSINIRLVILSRVAAAGPDAEQGRHTVRASHRLDLARLRLTGSRGQCRVQGAGASNLVHMGVFAVDWLAGWLAGWLTD